MKSFIEKNRSFIFFCFLVLLVVLVAVFAPFLVRGQDPTEGILANALQKPSGEHWFGTDKLGRDIFARVIYGTRASLTAALSVVVIIFAVGTVLGILAGYFGGVMDAVIMRFSDMMVSFPGMVLAISMVSWTKYARLARSLVLKIRHRDYVAAAVVTGSKTPYILMKYMLPNALPTLIITGATDIGSMMLELAGLSFLGFGAQAPTPEWGLMLNEGRAYMAAAPWLMIFPGFAILIVVVVFNLFGDSLRDVLDPRDE